MATPSDPDVSEWLKQKSDPGAQAQREAEFNKRALEQYQKSQLRLAEIVDINSTRPVTISSVTVLNAPNTRRGFLNRIFRPLLSTKDDEFYTLSEALNTIQKNVSKIDRFGIFHQPISTYYDLPDPTKPLSTPTDIDVFLSVREKSKFTASSGTWAGSNDGSVYLNLLLRNIFGGAETFNANASYGTRTRSAYSASFETPILSNPDFKLEIGGSQSSTSKSWASHDERLRGGLARLKYMTENGHAHELGYSGMWRQVTSLTDNASPTVRADAGDSFKSSLSHMWTIDRRDNFLLPTRGYLMKTIAELAGAGPLKGDVSFTKLEAETQSCLPIPIPFVKGDSGISFTTSLRGGLLCPLPLGGSNNTDVTHSRINDRFFLGGPADVRGFRYGGLGPHDGTDSVGGDVYAAGGASLLLPFPRVEKHHPLRLQAFINGGRLLSLQDPRSEAEREKGTGMDTKAVLRSLGDTVKELGNELPSCAAGIGLVYAPGIARFELNFSLPLVMLKGEEGRKGLSVGVGLTFL